MPLLAPVTKRAWTEHTVGGVAGSVDEAFRLALTPHRGPVFCDFPLEAIYGTEMVDLPPDAGRMPAAAPPDGDDVAAIATLLRAARRPVLVLGSDVWLGGAETAALGCAEALRLPVITNGQGRGVLPRGHSLLVTRARSVALAEADLVIVVGVPLDFRLRYGSFGPPDAPAKVVHVADSPGGIATHCPLAASASGDLAAFFTALADACGQRPGGRHGVAGAAAGDGAGGRGRGHPAAGNRGLPDPPDARLRRTAARARRRRGRHRRRRRLRLLRGPRHRACVPRPLARPRPLRLPGNRPRLRDGGPPGPPVVADRADAGRRRGRPVADGRRHPRPPQPASRHDRRQQLGLGPGEGADAGRLRLRRGRRPAPRHPLRRGRARPGRRRRAGNDAGARSPRRCAAPSTPASPTWST